MYAYLRSQEGLGVQSDRTVGWFVHPAIGESVYEQAEIQGSFITVATVNLTGTTAATREELWGILSSHGAFVLSAVDKCSDYCSIVPVLRKLMTKKVGSKSLSRLESLLLYLRTEKHSRSQATLDDSV